MSLRNGAFKLYYMKITINIKKAVKNAKCLPKNVGSVAFTKADLERMALQIYMLSEEISEDKFEYSAEVDLVEV